MRKAAATRVSADVSGAPGLMEILTAVVSRKDVSRSTSETAQASSTPAKSRIALEVAVSARASGAAEGGAGGGACVSLCAGARLVTGPAMAVPQTAQAGHAREARATRATRAGGLGIVTGRLRCAGGADGRGYFLGRPWPARSSQSWTSRASPLAT